MHVCYLILLGPVHWTQPRKVSTTICSETAMVNVLDVHLSVVCPLKVQFITIAEDLTALAEL